MLTEGGKCIGVCFRVSNTTVETWICTEDGKCMSACSIANLCCPCALTLMQLSLRLVCYMFCQDAKLY